MSESLIHTLSELWTEPAFRAVAVLAAAALAALLVRLIFSRVVAAFTRSTRTDVDDRIAAHLRGPAAWSVIFAACGWVAADAGLSETAAYLIRGVLITTVALMWSVAASRVARVLLEVVSDRVDQITWIQPKTVPLFDMIAKIAVVGSFLYFVCIAWRIPLTSWLTSAGIVGIAVGFAAKDTLANLFSGFFIIADAPYKVGDFIVLDGSLRGVVSEIGIRSTRLLTRDDIEVTVPNAVIANAQIVNETGGPHDKMRVRVRVEAAYGSDVDRVREVMLRCADGVTHVTADPAPRVRFREFGASGLVFELLAWIDEPVNRGRVLDDLNTRVYKAFAAAGIEIPYSKHDVYVKELPRGSGD